MPMTFWKRLRATCSSVRMVWRVARVRVLCELGPRILFFFVRHKMKELNIGYQDLLLLQVQNPLAVVSCLVETLHFQRKRPCAYLEKISLA